ncbi:MAG: DUF2207 domain-containing protein [Patescibacteria group bacterium]
MKNNFKSFICLSLLLFSLHAFHACAQENVSEKVLDSAFQTEKVNQMDIFAEIHPDASVSVIETIEYDFGSEYKHGIYRTIPLGFTAAGEPGHTTIRIDAVTDEAGNGYEYEVTSDDPVNIKIGNAESEITGLHTYRIFYTLNRSIGYFDDYDEWYWNLTGDRWEVPIQKVTATVVLPRSVKATDLMLKDYCGMIGATAPCGIFTRKEDGQTVFYATHEDFSLDVFEGVTIRCRFFERACCGAIATGLYHSVVPSHMDDTVSFHLRFFVVPEASCLSLEASRVLSEEHYRRRV